MKKLTIKILLVLALLVGAVIGSMILTGISGQPTVQAACKLAPCNEYKNPGSCADARQAYDACVYIESGNARRDAKRQSQDPNLKGSRPSGKNSTNVPLNAKTVK